jgi:uncharacterized protein YndB with AHSA1/START domain
MNQPAIDIQAYQIVMTRELNASRDSVFKAWTEPAMLKKWFGPDGVNTIAAEVDLRIGGRYRLTMQEPNGSTIVHGGTYRKIDPPDKLVFTWILDGQSCEGSEGQPAETVVTLDFEDLGSTTRLTLTHDFLPSERSKEGHTMGWTGSLDRLETVA